MFLFVFVFSFETRFVIYIGLDRDLGDFLETPFYIRRISKGFDDYC